MITMRRIEHNHYKSILTQFDKYIPDLFGLFWEWNESKLFAKNVSIFNNEFKIWLKHLVLTCTSPIDSKDKQTKYNYVPRNEKDHFCGVFEQCVSKIITNEWDKIFLITF